MEASGAQAKVAAAKPTLSAAAARHECKRHAIRRLRARPRMKLMKPLHIHSSEKPRQSMGAALPEFLVRDRVCRLPSRRGALCRTLRADRFRAFGFEAARVNGDDVRESLAELDA